MNPIPGAIFPVDPTIPADAPAYRYEVIVTVECGGSSYDTPVILETDERMDTRQARDVAIQDVRREGAGDGRSSPLPPGIDLQPCLYTSRVVSVGRRSDVPAIPQRR